VFLLGAERVVPPTGSCHLAALFGESEKVGRELTKEFYLRYADMRQDAFEQLCRDNPDVSRHDVLSATQKLLDRVLFCAFCEDRGLLPVDTIRKAYEHRDPYHPRPIWENFRGLFQSINRGNAALGIHAYNGGLFADDPLLDRLQVADAVCGYFRDLGAYDYRPAAQAASSGTGASLIDVDILGHIFEQSITDLERLRNELDGLAEPAGAEKHKTRRKKEGAFYTPAFITRYIIEQALGGVLRDRFEQLRRRHEQEAKGTARTALADPGVYELDKVNKPQQTVLVQFWEAWQDELAGIRLLDPACGSGAFLIEAFDQLHAAYQASNDRLQELRGHRSLFDLDRRILEHNLYGVDLNDEAIEICRLSLWIKTAQRGKTLAALDHPIRVGNSVVADPAVHPKAFDWQAAFPEVFKAGGFDVVVGNPPYIRQEWLTAYKAYWESRFRQVYAGTADIYVYFYALGIDLLRPGGRLAFVSSSAFARSSYAERLRGHLCPFLEQFVDLGDTQVFEDAKDVYPSIVVLSKGAETPARQDRNVRTIRLRRDDDAARISELVDSAGWDVPASRLQAEGWQFDAPAIISLRRKLHALGRPLTEHVGAKPCRGIVTGLNTAFLIDTPTRDRLLLADRNSEQIIKPCLRGQDIERWYARWDGLWIIFARRGIDIGSYPAVREYLEQFRSQLEPRPKDWQKGKWPGRKPGPYRWYEIQDSVDYWPAFEKAKIMYSDIAKSNRFFMDGKAFYAANTTYFVPSGDWYVLGILNSKPCWFAFAGVSIAFGERAGEFRYRFFSQYMERLPIPDASDADRRLIGDLAKTCSRIGAERYELQTKVQHRLVAAFGQDDHGTSLGELNTKAQAWWELSYAELGAALKTSFRLRTNPLKNPRTADEWEPYVAEKRAEADRQTRALADSEAELNDRVFALFHLTKPEIELLQREVEH
jgi:hypothetical protein